MTAASAIARDELGRARSALTEAEARYDGTREDHPLHEHWQRQVMRREIRVRLLERALEAHGSRPHRQKEAW